MYEAYWNLKEMPFENTPDPRFLYRSSQHEEALARMSYAIWNRKGAALLTGVFGCGKTVIAQAILSELSSEKYRYAYINNPMLSPEELLRSFARRLKSVALPEKKRDFSADYFLEILEKILYDYNREGKEVVLIIDEAHIIEDNKAFEELRLLLNFQLQEKFLLTLLILGQPELIPKINDYQALEQRIAIKCHLEHLDLKDTQQYIIHRLAITGRQAPVFTEEAIKLIYEYSGGVPRRINRLCDICLLAGFGKRVDMIGQDIVKEEIRGLGMPGIGLTNTNIIY